MADTTEDNGGNCDADAHKHDAYLRESATHHFLELRHDILQLRSLRLYTQTTDLSSSQTRKPYF